MSAAEASPCIRAASPWMVSPGPISAIFRTRQESPYSVALSHSSSKGREIMSSRPPFDSQSVSSEGRSAKYPGRCSVT